MTTYRERVATSPSQKIGLGRNGEPSAYLDTELARFGNNLWRGKPFEVAEDTVLRQGEGDVVLNVRPKNLPFNGNVSILVYDLLDQHVRSRFAHGFLDVKNLARKLQDGLLRSPRSPLENRPVSIKVKMINHGERPLGLRAGDSPVHLFYVPKEAEIVGDELDSVLDQGVVGIKGKQGQEWHKDRREGTPTKGLFLAIHKKDDERFWIPNTGGPLYIPSDGTFEDVRLRLFDPVHGALKKANDPEFPMPKGHIFVARLPLLTLPNNMYAVLDPVAYIGDMIRQDSFEEVGMQSSSPLLGPRSNEAHHVEMKETNGEKAEYARVRIVRAEEADMVG